MINLRGLYDFIPRLRTIEPRLVDTVLKVLVACSKEAIKMFALDPIRNGILSKYQRVKRDFSSLAN